MESSGRFVQRVLSPARAATRAKLIGSTITLASKGGYDAVTVRAVAAHAGTSVPTVYQHASSKDELLVEALMMLGEESGRQFRERPPVGLTPADRVSNVFARVMRAPYQRPLLYQALYRAWVASAPLIIAAEGDRAIGPARAAWIGEALRAGDTGDLAEDDLNSATRILSCLFVGSVIEVASGSSLDEALGLLTDAAHRLLGTSTSR